MKKIFLFLIIALFLINYVSAVDIVFDNFEDGNLNEWALTRLGTANYWASSTTNPYQGSYHAQSRPLYTTEPASVMERTISTSRYENIIFKYYKRNIGLDVADEFQVEWYNGTVWILVESTGSSSSNDAAYVSRSYSLPAGASDNPNFAIKFECTAGATSEYCRVDNVNISGTAMVDTTPPQFSDYIELPNNGSAYSSGQIYRFNATITETSIDKVWIEWENVNYTNGNIGNNGNVYIFNRTDLAAGTYYYRWWANDTNGNLNNSGLRYFTINKASTTTILYTSLTSPITYGTASNFSCSNSAGLETILYINGEDKTSEKGLEIIRAAGNYIVSCNSTENQNYSGSSQQASYIINKVTQSITALLNGANNNLVINYPQQVNASYSGVNYTAVTIKINSTQINIAQNYTFAAGNYFLNYSFAENQNYSFYETYLNLTINKATPVLTFLANGGTSNLTLIYPQQVNITAYPNFGIVGLDKDEINYLANNGLNVTLGAGSYIFRANLTGNQNYSDINYRYYNITISKATQTAILNINESSPIVYGKYINVTCNGGLFRNNIDITNEKGASVLLGAGSYNYSCKLYESQNYSYDDDNSTFVVNKAVPILTKKLNGIDNNLSVTYPQQVNASGTTSAGNLVIYRDGVAVNNGANYSLAAGYYRFDFNVTGNQNYTNVYGVLFANVSKLISSVSLIFDKSSPQIYGVSINASCSGNNYEATIKLYRDGIDVTDSENNRDIILGSGNYNYICNVSETQNYTSASDSDSFIINKATSTIEMYINGTAENQTDYYGVQTNVSVALGNSEQILNLYKNGIDDSSNLNVYQTLGIGNYNFTAVVSSTQNYNLLTITRWSYILCKENLQNTSWSNWINLGNCKADDLQEQIRNRTQYDVNSCGYVNATFYEYRNISCNYCSYNAVNTSWSDWYYLEECDVNDLREKQRNLTEYDANYATCYAITGLPSDLWNSGDNITHYENEYVACDYCTPILANTSWSEWENISCIDEKMNQSRFLIQYDVNDCGEIENQTIYEYRNMLDCINDTTPPSILIISPQNISYNTAMILINISSDGENVWWYNGTANLSYTEPVYHNFSEGSYLIYIYANDSFGNLNFTSVSFSVNFSLPEIINLIINCEAGGPYQKNALVLIIGNVSNNGLALNLQEVNVTIISKASKILITSSNGNFETSFSNLGVRNYILNATTTYNGVNASCTDNVQIGSFASLVLDKTATIYNLTDNLIIYNITLRLIDKGGSDALDVNITDEEVYFIRNLSLNSSFELSYLKSFERQDKTTYYELESATAYGIDEYSNLLISASSSSINISVPAKQIGKQITITKNIIYLSETSRNVSYNVSSTLYNSGDEDLNAISFIDADIGESVFFINITKGNFYPLSNLITIEKASSNTQHEFALGTAVVNGLVFYSNRPKVNIPGYGGPADLYVYAPVSVTDSTSFNSIIEVINMNPDIGQDFVIDYWITNNDENVNYSSGQKTVYVPASRQTNITVSLVSPAVAGNYKLKAIVFWTAGSASAFDSFEVSTNVTSNITKPPEIEEAVNKTEIINKTEENKTAQLKEIVCNKPYIRYGKECCLDENNNLICDYDEKPIKRKGIIGFFIKEENGEIKLNYNLLLILLIIAVLIYLIIRYRKAIFSLLRRMKKATNRLSSLIGLEVYSSDGKEIGKVKDIMIKNYRIESLKIKLKKKLKIRGIFINYKYVKGLGDIIIVDERVLDDIRIKEGNAYKQ